MTVPIPEWPFGHDPTDPPWRFIRPDTPEAIPADGAGNLAVRRRYQHTAADFPPLRLTVAEPLNGSDPAAVTKRLTETLEQIEVYYHMFQPPHGVPPAGIEFPDYGAEVEREVKPSFTGVLELAGGDSLTTFTVELLTPPPGDDDDPMAVGVTLDPWIGPGKVHGYVARCTRSAWVSVRATAGAVKLTVTKNGSRIASTQDGAGGGSSSTIGANTRTPATFDVSVTGLKAYNFYHLSLGWVLGTGGGC